MIKIPIDAETLQWAKETARKLDAQNTTLTMEGGKEKNIKGCLAQWAVDEYLDDEGWSHTYSLPFVNNQHGDSFDILVGEDVWDVKCRGTIEDVIKYGTLLMGENERSGKVCSYYIFCTVDPDFSNVYILGGKNYHNTWDELVPLSEKSQAKMKYKAAGNVKVSSLKSIMNVLMHT
jgi:hypothetical protein